MNNTSQTNTSEAEAGNGGFGMILRRSLEALRQWTQPAPFRIAAPFDLPTPPGNRSVEAPPAAPPPAHSGPNTTHYEQALKMLPAVATALWRIRVKLTAEPAIDLPAPLRLLPRHVESAWDALKAAGLEVQDHVGQRYDPGMAVNPVTYRPEESVPPNTIVEALKPTVFFCDMLIQRADVILAAPRDSSDSVGTESPTITLPASPSP